MIVLRFFLSLFFWIYVQIAMLFVTLVSYPAALLPGRGRAFTYFLTRYILKFMFLVCFIRFKIRGKENMPSGGRVIFLSNKPNLIATFGLIAHFPARVRFVADSKLFRFPFLGRVVKSIGCIASTGRKEDTFAFAGAVLSSLRGGEPVLFYPENMRGKYGVVGRFKETEVRMAGIAGALLVPLLFKGTERVLPEDSTIISPGVVDILISSPIKIAEGSDPKVIAGRLDGIYKELMAGRA